MTAKDGLPCKKCGANEWNKFRECVQCANGRAKKWQKDNSIKRALYMRLYRVLHPKSLTERDKLRVKEWQQENPGKHKAIQQLHRARKKNNGGSYAAEEWKKLCDSYSNKCLCCGRDDVVLTVDHIIPFE